MAKNFTVVRGDSPEGLLKKADDLTEKGWEPQGNPFQWLDGMCWIFYKKAKKTGKEKK